MFGLFTKLFSKNRTTNTARTARRASLQVESLEDRMVPTTLSLFRTSLSSAALTLSVKNIAQGHTIQLQCLPNNNSIMEVLDNGNVVDNEFFSKASINVVNIQVAGGNNVLVNDSNGMPFAPGTAINLFGSGTNNSLVLFGNRAVAGNETYVAGGASFTPGELLMDNLAFNFSNAISTVNDGIQITGRDDVQTSGTNVGLSGSNGVNQTLTGMGFGGGDTLTFASKPVVELDEFAVNANVLLNATQPELLEANGGFDLVLHGTGDTATIAAAPRGVSTSVQTNIAPIPVKTSVFLQANTGAVYVQGTSATFVQVGQQLSNGLFSTHGIQGTVWVDAVGTLDILDNGNVSTTENVTVTPTTISGTGLFGNSSVTVSYFSVGSLNLFAGQLADQYTVEGNGFTTPIQITDEFSQSFRADVYVGLGSHLNLAMWNDTIPKLAELFIHPLFLETVVKPDGQPAEGVVDLLLGNELSSQVDYLGYSVSVV